MRLAVGSLALVIFTLLRGGFNLTSPGPAETAFFAGAGNALYQVTFFSGLRLTGVAVALSLPWAAPPLLLRRWTNFLQKEKPSRAGILLTLRIHHRRYPAGTGGEPG